MNLAIPTLRHTSAPFLSSLEGSISSKQCRETNLASAVQDIRTRHANLCDVAAMVSSAAILGLGAALHQPSLFYLLGSGLIATLWLHGLTIRSRAAAAPWVMRSIEGKSHIWMKIDWRTYCVTFPTLEEAERFTGRPGATEGISSRE